MPCVPVADVTARRKLRSATRGLLDFPRYNTENYGRRAFSYAGIHARTPATNCFNRPFQALAENVFIRADIAFSTLETFCLMGYISLLAYLLTYLHCRAATMAAGLMGQNLFTILIKCTRQHYWEQQITSLRVVVLVFY